MGVMQKILELRKKVKDKNLRMTGENKLAGYKYYQLNDFLPLTIDLCLELGLYDEYTEEDGIKILRMVDVETGEERIFKTEKTIVPPPVGWRDGEKIGTAMQRINSNVQSTGSVDTYIMRYLYRNMLKLVEPDFTEIMQERNELISRIYSTPKEHQEFAKKQIGGRNINKLSNEELRAILQNILKHMEEVNND